jgi:Protein of unknown function (DUF2497)
MFIEQAVRTQEPSIEGQLRQLMECEVNNALAQTVLLENARTLQDLVREMLRPMLKSWLDDNLPTGRAPSSRRDRADDRQQAALGALNIPVVCVEASAASLWAAIRLVHGTGNKAPA